MNLRVIDYIVNDGGSLRYQNELFEEAFKLLPNLTIEYISHGVSLKKAAQNFSHLKQIKFIDIPPIESYVLRMANRILPPLIQKVFFRLFPETRWAKTVPNEALMTEDIVFFPWIHNHQVQINLSDNVFGVIQDAIIFRQRTLAPKSCIRLERKIIKKWIDSKARIICTTNTSSKNIAKIFNVSQRRFNYIHLSTTAEKPTINEKYLEIDKPNKKYFYYAANTSPHKNHEVLFDALKFFKNKYSLALAGTKTDLLSNISSRSKYLCKYANKLNLTGNKDYYGYGYISHYDHQYLFKNASAIIFPSKDEGWGYPVFEAISLGIPLICASLEIYREIFDDIENPILWFDPNDYKSLVKQIKFFDNNYIMIKNSFKDFSKKFPHRTPKQVAQETINLLNQGQRL